MPLIGIRNSMNLIKFKEPFKYLIVGLICQLSDYVITIVTFYSGLNLFVSNSSGYILASIFSYIGHSKFTFSKKSKKLNSKKQILLFFLACLLGIFSGYLVIKIFFILKITIEKAKFFQLLIIAIVQYFFNSKITFRK